MSHIMASKHILPNLSLTTSLHAWKKERQELLCFISQIFRISPFADENAANDNIRLDDFCAKLSSYLMADHFAHMGIADLPINALIIEQMLSSINKFLIFNDRYHERTQYDGQDLQVQQDLLIISEELAHFLTLEEICITYSAQLLF